MGSGSATISCWSCHGDAMKIETTPLKAKVLLTLLEDPAIRKIAIEHYAAGNLDELLAALEKAAEEKWE